MTREPASRKVAIVSPRRRAEIGTMQQQDGSTVGRRRLDIHVCHSDILSLRFEAESLHIVWIGEALQFGSVGIVILGAGCGQRTDEYPGAARTDEKLAHLTSLFGLRAFQRFLARARQGGIGQRDTGTFSRTSW